MTPPKLSIITINLNNGAGLIRTVESVIKQTYNSYEYIVIDGASTDGSVDVIELYNDYLHYWISEKDDGIYSAMNKGVNIATGEYCLFLNSGDILANKHVLKTVFEHDLNEDIIIGACNLVRERSIIHTVRPSNTITFKSFYKNTIPHQSTIIKRSLFKNYGNYLENYKIHSDYDFWIRTIILNSCTTKTIDIIISEFDMNGISTQSKYVQQSKKEIDNILESTIPERILSDYKEWESQQEQLKVLYWIQSKQVIYHLLTFVYNISRILVKFKLTLKRIIHV